MIFLDLLNQFNFNILPLVYKVPSIRWNLGTVKNSDYFRRYSK